MVRFIVVFSFLVLPVTAIGADNGVTNKDATEFGDTAKGEAIAKQVCTICHGMDGNSPLAINPNLAGQHSGYLYKQLLDFKSGARSNAIMTGMIANLSENDLRNLAAYYESKPARTPAATRA